MIWFTINIVHDGHDTWDMMIERGYEITWFMKNGNKFQTNMIIDYGLIPNGHVHIQDIDMSWFLGKSWVSCIFDMGYGEIEWWIKIILYENLIDCI